MLHPSCPAGGETLLATPLPPPGFPLRPAGSLPSGTEIPGMPRCLGVLLFVLALALPALAEPPGTVTVTSPAGPAQVTLDGAPAGRTPVTLRLPPGPHVVRVVREGLAPFEQTLEVRSGASQAVEAVLPLLEGPGQILYVEGRDPSKVGPAWLALQKRTPGLRGPSLVRQPARGWVGVASKALEGLEPEPASEAARALSSALGARVLHLAVTPDERAWYFFWEKGHLVDRYCSDPGRDADSGVLRAWAGRPEALLPVCRGTPLSSRRTEVSLTDLHGLVYFYSPELRQARPGAWRSAADLMRLLAQVLGTPDPPAPFRSLSAAPGWKKP